MALINDRVCGGGFERGDRRKNTWERRSKLDSLGDIE
jgi:hypothetical protein